MAEPIYKFWMSRPTEAWYQLSEEEKNAHMAQSQEALHKVGGKTMIQCSPVWSNQEWLLCGVEEFPDMDAVQKHAELLFAIDHFRYLDGKSMLGTKWPPG
ncbi:MAG: hypothetical protein JXA89_21480 [Anaerolineae bacterium]|nr:hypothetical protein [Anaerolineae bacterium]